VSAHRQPAEGAPTALLAVLAAAMGGLVGGIVTGVGWLAVGCALGVLAAGVALVSLHAERRRWR
jgi:hypothetical protein